MCIDLPIVIQNHYDYYQKDESDEDVGKHRFFVACIPITHNVCNNVTYTIVIIKGLLYVAASHAFWASCIFWLHIYNRLASLPGFTWWSG